MSEELLLNNKRGNLTQCFNQNNQNYFCMGAKTIDHARLRNMDLSMPHQKHRPLGYQSLIVAMLLSFLFLAKLVLRSERNRDHSIMKKERVKKSFEKSKNVLEEELKNGQFA